MVGVVLTKCLNAIHVCKCRSIGEQDGHRLRFSLRSDVVQIRTERRRRGTAQCFKLRGSSDKNIGLGDVYERRGAGATRSDKKYELNVRPTSRAVKADGDDQRKSPFKSRRGLGGKGFDLTHFLISETQLAGLHYSFGLTRIASADDGSGDGGMM